MNKYKFVAELERLLGFMSSWDRQAAIAKYTAMFDEAEDVDILIAKLGSPTKLAISLAKDYVPTDPPAAEEASAAEDAAETEGSVQVPDPEEPQSESAPVPEEAPPELSFEEPGETPVPVPAEAPVPAAAEEYGEDEEAPADEPAAPGRKARPAALVFYTLLSLLIGLPIAIVLIALGVPFLAAGAGVAAFAIWGAAAVISCLTVVSDILLVLGVTIAAVAVGLLLAWLGLWISLELGYVWIGRVIFGLGGRLCFKKEVARE